jgi:hypothetical protein
MWLIIEHARLQLDRQTLLVAAAESHTRESDQERAAVKTRSEDWQRRCEQLHGEFTRAEQKLKVTEERLQRASTLAAENLAQVRSTCFFGMGCHI